MIVPVHRLMQFVPPSVTRADVEACRVTVRPDPSMALHMYRVVMPDGVEITGGCTSERAAIEQAAFEIAFALGAYAEAAS